MVKYKHPSGPLTNAYTPGTTHADGAPPIGHDSNKAEFGNLLERISKNLPGVNIEEVALTRRHIQRLNQQCVP